MRIEGLRDAVFLRRLNRFVAEVSLDGAQVACHVPNSGRLTELLVAGAPARVLPKAGEGRTACALVMVLNEGQWVVIDAHRANAVAREAVEVALVPGLERAECLRREVVCGASRFDMACTVGGVRQYVEVKCSTLQREGVGLFPDAPTERGRKHLRELAELARSGLGCHVLFVMQHPASRAFAPNRETDPAFAAALAEVVAAGVRVHALVCETTESSVLAVGAVPYQ
jgi:sugar fermentation stimulation protein A